MHKTNLKRLVIILMFTAFCFSPLCLRSAVSETDNGQQDDASIGYGSYASFSEYTNDLMDVTVTTPEGLVIHACRYTGNAAQPGSFPGIANYPSATQKKAGSWYYNCHGYAWYFCGKTTGVTNAKAFYLSSAGADEYSCSSCYTLVSGCTYIPCNELTEYRYRSKLHVGDIIVYLSDNDNQMSMPQFNHSAVIKSISSSAITVQSKWEQYPVYEHYATDCPYAISPTPYGADQYTKVDVYHPTHFSSGTIYTNNSVIPTQTGTTAFVFPEYISYNDSKHKTICDCGRAYKLQNHNLVHLAGTIYKCTYCNYRYDSGAAPQAHEGEG